MKTALKKFASFYLNTWWFPPLLAVFAPVVLICAFTIAGAVGLLIGVPLMYALLLGVPVTWGWLAAKGNKRGALWSFFVYLVVILFTLTLMLP